MVTLFQALEIFLDLNVVKKNHWQIYQIKEIFLDNAKTNEDGERNVHDCKDHLVINLIHKVHQTQNKFKFK